MIRVDNLLHKIILFALIAGGIPFFVMCSKPNNKGSLKTNRVAGKNANISEYPKFEFTKELHKFGEILEGEIGVCDFYFKNVGTTNLHITRIESSCGCTNFKWKKEPIKVGEESKITVEFDSKGRYGKQYKTISIFSNTMEGENSITITANVK